MDWILYNIFLSRASHFLVMPPENCRGDTVGPVRAHEKSTPSAYRKLLTFLILCREWHKWREELENKRRKQWEDRAEESPS